MISCAFLQIKLSTRVLHYLFKVGNNSESKDLEKSTSSDHESKDLEKSTSSALPVKGRADIIIANSRSNINSNIYFYKGL